MQQTTAKQGKLEIVPEEEEAKGFVSFSQDFNDMVEKKRPSSKKGVMIKDYGSSSRRTSTLSSQNNNNANPHLETMAVNFQTCHDDNLDDYNGAMSSSNFRGNSS